MRARRRAPRRRAGSGGRSPRRAPPSSVRDGALHRLADPPGRIGRELVAAAPVELLDRAVEAERPLLDQVEERYAEAAVDLRDRHDETQVRFDHAPLRALVAALDR